MNTVAGRHFKNEDCIKDLIVAGHRQGVCDSSGRSTRTNIDGRRIFTARPRFGLSSAVKTYVYRTGKKGQIIRKMLRPVNGKMVLKE